VYLGAVSSTAGLKPYIQEVSAPQTINSGTSATIWAKGTESDYTVTALIIPPGYTPPENPDLDSPVAELPSVVLPYNQTMARYEGTYDGLFLEGDYKISISAQDSGGNLSTPSITWVIQESGEEVQVVAGFRCSSTYGTAPLTVSFTDTSVGEVDSWSWDFGDGGTSTEQHPIHTYDGTGFYTVSLNVTGSGGADTITRTNYITVTESGGAEEGFLVTSDLWIRAAIHTEEKGPIEAVWQKGGEDVTSRGDEVIWGHFYASPEDVSWGSQNNPELFVKIWFDISGRVDVNYFHVSVPDIEVYSAYPYEGSSDVQNTTTMSTRYVRQYYVNEQSYSEENNEDGIAVQGYSPGGNPWGNITINNLRIGAIINTEEVGPVEAVWRLGGQDTTTRGDQVVWGHFYANPNNVTWGSLNNPEVFVKIWFDVGGRLDVNFFHVSVPDIEVYSDYPNDGTYDQAGTCIMADRYIRQEYQQ
jgi:PKD repeat protein